MTTNPGLVPPMPPLAGDGENDEDQVTQDEGVAVGEADLEADKANGQEGSS